MKLAFIEGEWSTSHFCFLGPGKEPLVPIEEEAGCAPRDSVDDLEKRKIS